MASFSSSSSHYDPNVSILGSSNHWACCKVRWELSHFMYNPWTLGGCGYGIIPGPVPDSSGTESLHDCREDSLGPNYFQQFSDITVRYA